jgi:hypothetical protein
LKRATAITSLFQSGTSFVMKSLTFESIFQNAIFLLSIVNHFPFSLLLCAYQFVKKRGKKDHLRNLIISFDCGKKLNLKNEQVKRRKKENIFFFNIMEEENYFMSTNNHLNRNRQQKYRFGSSPVILSCFLSNC